MHVSIISAVAALALTISAVAAPPPRSGSGPPGRGGPPPKPQPEAPQEPPSPPVVPEPQQPLGFAGESPFPDAPTVRNIIQRETLAVPDRWRIGWPKWDRYGRMTDDDPIFMNNNYGDSPFTLGHPLNPYDRNVFKGDYPIAGDDIFFNATFISDTLFVYRKLPTPSGVSAGGPGKLPFFGEGDQLFVNQNFFLTMDLFKGNTAFRPVDWLIRVTPAYNINYLELQEDNNVNIDTRVGDERDDDHFSLQETFYEYHLGDMSPFFDVAAIRIGRQLFVSDFRGFIFNDISDGVRLLGNFQSNRIQYNLALFNQNDKDTNSELNELNWRDQQLLIANVYIQDFIWMGYTTQFSFHWNHDQSDEHYDNNGFLVIPDLIGSANLHNIDAYYLGWAGDGHIGRINVNHAFYYVFGEDDGNPLAGGRPLDLSAFMGALELSVDIDWLRPKLSFLYASGDRDPFDDTAGGFDGIFDNPFFAGGPSSFYQNLPVRLFNVNLVSAKSFYNDLAGAKAEGQANYTGPGTILLGGGFDAEITPRLRSSFNVNSLWFADTSSLELVLTQPNIDSHIGVEVNLFAQYRPLLNNNVILTGGGSAFYPGDGFTDIYGSDETLYQGYVGLTLTY